MSDLFGGSTSVDVDVDRVETELNAYTRVQQVPLDTDPLMWWKQHVQEFPRLAHMTRRAFFLRTEIFSISINCSLLAEVCLLSVAVFTLLVLSTVKWEVKPLAFLK